MRHTLKSEATWSSAYFGGLQNIKRVITERLVGAGAKIEPGCISHPVISRVDGNPPAALTITIVPFNGPRQALHLSDEDFLRSGSDIDAVASAKIEELVASFRMFRLDRNEFLGSAERRTSSIRSSKRR
jgi:hypothetical protein